MTTRHAPPRLAARLVEALLPPEAREPVLGDLDERFRDRALRDGRAAAARWYWRQTLAFAFWLPATQGAGRARAFVAGSWRVGLAADLRQAARALRRRPALTTTALAVLALATGATIAVFSVVDAVLIQRLPYPQPDRLVMLWDHYADSATPDARSPVAMVHVRQWQEQTDLFKAIGAYDSTQVGLDHGEWPERVDGAQVTPGLLPLLGATPALGRLFVPEDDLPGADPVVILSHDLWRLRFGGDPAIVGRRIAISKTPTRVVGVLAPDFWFYDPYAETRSLTGRNAASAQLWQPLPRAEPFEGMDEYPAYRVIARLADGLAVDAAAEIGAARRIAMPPTSSGQAELRLLPLAEQVRADSRGRLIALLGAVTLVLLIACVNLVSLLLVHVDSRRPEFAVRLSLGAGRARLVRQLVIESTVLAAVGSLLGLAVAQGIAGWLVQAVPRGLPLAHRVDLDARVVLFGLGVAVVAGLAIGLTASLALDGRRVPPRPAATRTATGSRRSRRLHATLIAAEVALSLTLLIAATLLTRSFVGLRTTDPGFDVRGVLTFEAILAPNPEGEPNLDFFEALEARLAAMPGVTAVGSTSALPFSRWSMTAGVTPPEGPAGEGPPGRADFRMVSPGYFRAIGLPIRQGRGFDERDEEGAPEVFVVDEAFVAEHLAGDPQPVGRRITLTRGRTINEGTIVGVVGNVKHRQLYERDRPTAYTSALLHRSHVQRFAVRVAGGDPTRMVDQVRAAARAVDPGQPLQGFMAFDALVAQSIEEETFYAQALGAFALCALLLTLVGIYGIVAFAVRQRQREVGIRIALGAGAGRVRRLVLAGGLTPVAAGLCLGVWGGVAASRAVSGLLHGLSPHDTGSYVAATLAVLAVAAAACLVPARRAARVDPVQALRAD